MQSSRQVVPAVGVIFDCDMGNGIEDVLALAMLYGLDTKTEARVVSVSVSNSSLKSAALCDAIARFYVSATWGQFASFARVLPVGMSDVGKSAGDNQLATAVLAKRSAEDKPLYPTDVTKLNDTADPSALIRNAVTAHHDGNAVVVLGGPATNLAAVLGLRGAKELIAKKVRMLAVAGGRYPSGDPEFNITADIAAAKRLFAEWPGPILACGPEIGEAVPYPGASIAKDYAWAPAHPVVDAYTTYKPLPYDAPAPTLAVALQALRPKENYFKLSEPGTISVRDDGRTEFTASADGKHRYLILDPAQKDKITQAYTELASAKPVPRRPRFGQQAQQQQEAEKKKQEAAKPPTQ